MRLSNKPKLHYPILLFVTILPFAASRPVSGLVDGVGRNSIWFIFPIVLLVIAGTWMNLQISRRYGNTSLMLASGEIMFRWLTPVTYILYAILYFGVATYMIALGGDFSSRALLYSDPRKAMLLYSIISACAALFPIETMLRYAQVIMFLVTPLFILVTSTMLMNAHWSWLYPLFHVKEIVHPVSAMAALMCIFSPLATVTLVNRKDTKVSFRSLSRYILFSAVFMAYLVGMSIATFGVHTSKKIELLIYYGQSAVHLESSIFERIIFLNSVLLIYFKVVGNAFMLRCAALGLTQTFGVKLGVIPILLLGGICAILLWTVNLPTFFLKAPVWIGYYTFALLVALPALLYLFMFLRRKTA